MVDRGQTAQDLPGAVNVVHAPTAIPGAIVVLRVDQVLDRALYGRRLGIEMNVAEKFERTSGEVTARGIKNCVVVRERHVLEPGSGHILVESAPAAVFALETELPCDRPLEKSVQLFAVSWLNESQCHQNHGGVIGVRIINVVVLECPATGF